MHVIYRTHINIHECVVDVHLNLICPYELSIDFNQMFSPLSQINNKTNKTKKKKNKNEKELKIGNAKHKITKVTFIHEDGLHNQLGRNQSVHACYFRFISIGK